LVRRDAFLVLDLGLDVVDGVRGLDIESDRLSGQGLDENLYQTEKRVLAQLSKKLEKRYNKIPPAKHANHESA
jgi:hypothetical protein